MIPEPINTVTFAVTGSNEAALRDEAEKRLREYTIDIRDWVYGIDARPIMVAMDGTVDLWEGEVTAVRRDD